MTNTNITLNTSYQYTDNVNSQTPLNRVFQPLIAQLTTVYYSAFFIVGTILQNLDIPSGSLFNALIIRNLSTTATVSIYLGNTVAPANPTAVLAPGGAFILFNPGTTLGGGGAEQLQVLASAANTPIEYLVGF